MDRLRRNYRWKGFGDMVAQAVRACMYCARTKGGFREIKKELQQVAIQGLMFRWRLDFGGTLPITNIGNKYVLVCIEHSTKWVELIALPTKSSSNAARAFPKYISSTFGAPRVVLTDQGT